MCGVYAFHFSLFNYQHGDNESNLMLFYKKHNAVTSTIMQTNNLHSESFRFLGKASLAPANLSLSPYLGERLKVHGKYADN
jgi:hypothetical protein